MKETRVKKVVARSAVDRFVATKKIAGNVVLAARVRDVVEASSSVLQNAFVSVFVE